MRPPNVDIGSSKFLFLTGKKSNPRNLRDFLSIDFMGE